MEGSVSILLGCIGITSASRTVSFCFSFSHVARYAPLWKTKNNGTIAANPSQTNIESTYNYFLRLLFVSSTNKRFIDAKKCNYTPFLEAKKN